MEDFVRLCFSSRRVVVTFALFVLSIPPAMSFPGNPVAENVATRVNPGDDFYRYANGEWLGANTIPTGQSSYDNRAIMAARASKQVLDLIQNAASAHADKGGV